MKLLRDVSLGALAATGALLFSPTAFAEPPAEAKVTVEVTAASVTYGSAVLTRYRVGAKFVARGGSVQNIRSLVAVPLECPEQEVEVLEEDYSPAVENVEFRQTDEGVRQMLISIPLLPPREEAHATVTYEVRTSTILPPTDTATLLGPKKPDRKLKRYLGRSPYIDVNDRKIRAAAREALASIEVDGDDEQETKESEDSHEQPAAAEASAAEGLSDWRRVEALYDYAIEHVKYEEGADKSAVQTLAEGRGDCQAIAALFVALCRTEKIPARMVWVDGHQYAEFYLEDAAGAGHWYPVESAGRRAFGEMPVARVILQKGDNFSVPERPRERLRYASDYTLLLSKPGSQPKITYVHEQL